MEDYSKLVFGSFVPGSNQQTRNMGKAGYYPTDLLHMKKMASMLRIEPGVSALDPCIGDGGAFFTLVKAQPDCRKFGVELREEAAKALADSGKMECCLQGDFLEDIRSSRNAFDLVFANPPYGQQENTKHRIETLFLQRITQLIRTGGLLVWVIPYIMFGDTTHKATMELNYTLQGLYRFSPGEFEKYHQVVLFLRKQPPARRDFPDLSRYQSAEEAKALPFLPEDVPEEEKLIVTASATNRILEFRRKELDVSRALLAQEAQEAKTGLSRSIWPDGWVEHATIAPPRFPFEDTLNLLNAGGVGDHLVSSGDEKEKKVFRCRGNVKRQEAETMVMGKDKEGRDKVTGIKVRSYATAEMAVIVNGRGQRATIARLGNSRVLQEDGKEE